MPKGAETPREGKVRTFLRRITRTFRNRFVSAPDPAVVTATGRIMSRPSSATSRQFLLMSEIFMTHGYMVGPKIGTGNYAKVRVIERRRDAKLLAAKIIYRDRAPKDYVKNFMPRELAIIQSIKHENIAAVYDVVETSKMVFIVMDYAQRGDLLEYIKGSGAQPEPITRKMFSQVASAVEYLHSEGIAHRDLKCENILLQKNGDTLLTDFGFSCRFDIQDPSNTFCGSAAYASPQLIEGIPYNAFKNDVWALGCVLFIIACGSMPYDDSNMKKMIKKQKQGVFFPSKMKDKVGKDLKALIKKILVHDEAKRCSMAEVLDDEWLKSQPETEKSGPVTNLDSVTPLEVPKTPAPMLSREEMQSPVRNDLVAVGGKAETKPEDEGLHEEPEAVTVDSVVLEQAL